MDAKQLSKAVRRVNLGLASKNYHETHSQAILWVQAWLVAEGFDATVLDGLYCGEDGQTVQPLGTKPGRWVTVTWHKLQSGRFEVVAYVS